MKIIFFAILFLTNISAYAGSLEQIKEFGYKDLKLESYSIASGGLFKITEGKLKAKTIAFLGFPLGEKSVTPQFIVADGAKILDRQNIPDMTQGWNIVQVDAVSAVPSPAQSLRILAIVTFEPISNRSEDYWTNPYVFDIDKSGKIFVNSALNKKLAKNKPPIKTIKNLKKFLK